MIATQTNPTVTKVNEESTRDELLEAFGWCNERARRTPAFDSLSRPSREWDTLHAFLDYLLDLWALNG